MKTINWRPKHGVVLILLLAVGVAVFQEKSCYGERKLFDKKDLTIRDKLAGQQITISTMTAKIRRAEEIQGVLESKGIYKGDKVPPELTELKDLIEKLKREAAVIAKDIKNMNDTKAKLLAEVKALRVTKESFEKEKDKLKKEMQILITERDNLKEEMEPLKTERDDLQGQVNTLQSTKNTLIAWFGGGMTTSIAGIVLLVLKIMSQRKDIKLKQIEIDKQSKKK